MTEKRQLAIEAKLNDKASQGFAKIGRSLKDLGTTARKALGGLPTLIGAVLAGAAVRKGVDTFNDLAGGLAQVADSATSLNTTADSLYILRNAVAENGVEFPELTAALRTFERTIGDARLGATAQAEAIQRLGLTTAQFIDPQKDAVETLASVADGLLSVEDVTVRTKIALQLFGEDTGSKLLPVLAAGGQALRTFAAGQREVGNAFTAEQIQRAADYRSAVVSLTNTLKTFTEQVVLDAAPAVTEFLNQLKQLIEQNGPAIRDGMLEILDVMTQGIELIVDLGFVVRQAAQGWDIIAKGIASTYLELFGTNREALIAKRRLREAAEEATRSNEAWDNLGKQFDTVRERIRAMREEQGRQIRESLQRRPAEQVSVMAAPSSDLDQFFDGFAKQIETASARWGDFYRAGQNAATQLVERGLDRLSDSIADVIVGASSAKEAFRQLAQALLKDLARVIARMLVVRAVSSLSGLFGGGSGGGTVVQNEKGGVMRGSMGRPVKVGAFEYGGIARGPTLALFGEGRASKGEAFVPLPDGRSIPVTMQGGGAGTTLNFHISAVDGQSVRRMLVEERGTISAILRDAVQNNQHGMRQVIQRATA